MLQHVGFTFFPTSDRGQLTVKLEMPLGSSIHQTTAAAEAFAEPLLENQRIRGEVVNVIDKHLADMSGLREKLANMEIPLY